MILFLKSIHPRAPKSRQIPGWELGFLAAAPNSCGGNLDTGKLKKQRVSFHFPGSWSRLVSAPGPSQTLLPNLPSHPVCPPGHPGATRRVWSLPAVLRPNTLHDTAERVNSSSLIQTKLPKASPPQRFSPLPLALFPALRCSPCPWPRSCSQ